MLVDSHVNLHGEKFADDLTEVLTRSEAAGVTAMLAISDQLSSLPEIEKISRAHDHIWHSAGIHPHHARDYQEISTEKLIDIVRQSGAIGVGECGLDLYYEYSDIESQTPVFQAHIETAQSLNLPLIIHSRNADQQMQAMLADAYATKPFTPLMHCYTSGRTLAEKALELGGYISFSGIITFKNAEEVRAIAEMVPLDRLLVETDCPYLAPVPFRGRRCEPAHVVHVAEKLAELKGVTRDEISSITSDNFFRLFTGANRELALQA